MNQFKITILIVNFNSSDFVENSLYCLDKITKNNYIVSIVDGSPEEDEFLGLKKRISKYENVSCERMESGLRGSMQHGTLLNYLVSKVETPYFSILDADATFLAKDWDQILIDRMDRKTPVYGTQAPKGKPQDFPLMFAILFRTKEFKELNIDFRPKDINQKQDTGFDMRGKYLEAGYRGGLINFFSTRDFKKGSFYKLITAEYYLEGVSHIFASHFGRGSTLGKNKYMSGRNFLVTCLYKIPLIGKCFVEMEGLREKRLWLKICREVVDSQNK